MYSFGKVCITKNVRHRKVYLLFRLTLRLTTISINLERNNKTGLLEDIYFLIIGRAAKKGGGCQGADMKRQALLNFQWQYTNNIELSKLLFFVFVSLYILNKPSPSYIISTMPLQFHSLAFLCYCLGFISILWLCLQYLLKGWQ